jgi:hypothetical protein
VDLGTPVVPDEQPLELVEPGEGSLDDPACAPESGAVLSLATSDLGRDPAPAQLAPVRVVVVGAVGGQALGTSARPANTAPYCRDGIDQRE